MRTIYKYQIPIEGRFRKFLPKEAVILSFQCQDGVPTIWVELNTAHVNIERWFRFYGTGQAIEDIPKDAGLHYIGTAQQSQTPPLVWHLFEEVKNDQNEQFFDEGPSMNEEGDK